MDTNKIITDTWSNPETRALYSDWRKRQEDKGIVCMGCRHFAKMNDDFGLCGWRKSLYFLETVSEHFVCTEWSECPPCVGSHDWFDVSDGARFCERCGIVQVPE